MEFWKPSRELSQQIALKTTFSLFDIKSEAAALGIDQLVFAMFVFIADKMTKRESLNVPLTLYYLGQQILRYYLGDSWVEANVFDNEPGSLNRHKRGRDFLKSDFSNNEDNFRHQHRVIELAECLFNLQQIPGINGRMTLLEHENLNSLFGELQCARIMATPQSQLQFINPIGVKQHDYDAEITTPAGRKLCCEIKAKDQSTELCERTIKNTIEGARKQLPKDRPGMVWITIPEEWSKQAGAKTVVDKGVLNALGRSNRLVAVHVAFEVWEAVDSGRLISFRFTTALNTKSTFYEDDVEAAIAEFGSSKRPEWYTLDNIIRVFYSDCINFVSAKIGNEA